MELKKAVKIGLIILVIVIMLVIAAVVKNKLESKNSVPENDPNLVGNTAGNIYNGGYFAETNGKVYFSNAYDNGNLYVMDSNQQNIEKLAGAKASFLNVAGDFLYYYSVTGGEQTGLGYVRNGRGFFRTSIDGDKTYTLAKGETDSFLLVGNHLYYTLFSEDQLKENQADVTVHAVSCSNEDDKMIIDQHAKVASFANGNLYYSGIDENHFLYAYNIASGISSIVMEEYVYLPIISGDEVYYLDLKDNYKLKKYSLSDGSIATIVDERIDSYNLYGNIIYYQTCNPDDYALKRVSTDGSNVEVVKEGVFNNINITSTYVYFTEFQNEIPVYTTPTYGSVNVTTFDAALSAVIK